MHQILINVTWIGTSKYLHIQVTRCMFDRVSAAKDLANGFTDTAHFYSESFCTNYINVTYLLDKLILNNKIKENHKNPNVIFYQN